MYLLLQKLLQGVKSDAEVGGNQRPLTYAPESDTGIWVSQHSTRDPLTAIALLWILLAVKALGTDTSGFTQMVYR